MNMMTPLPGCAPCPPGGLIDCYGSIQAATAFISALMIDAINNNPDVAQAIVDAIVKSGSNVPLIGVTNGSVAQPGQVGEFVRFSNSLPYAVNASPTTITFSAGVLQPGDWDVWAWASPTNLIEWVTFFLSPTPAGFSDNLFTGIGTGGTTSNEGVVFVSTQVEALITAPTLLAFTLQYSSSTSGNITFVTTARRRR